MAEAFRARQENFGWDVTFIFPAATRALSLTGKICDQGCAHCSGRFLLSMEQIGSFLGRARRGETGEVRSLLVSGGFAEPMKLSLLSHRESIEELRQMGYILNFHAGLPDAETIEFLVSHGDAVSLDIITDPGVLERVYKVRGFSGKEFIAAYLSLRDRIKTVPHLCIGLDKGRIGWEYDAVARLSSHLPATVTFNILKSSRGTEFEKVDPPSLRELTRFFSFARIQMPKTTLVIGCMRPGGNYRVKADNLALLAGFNKIVSPAFPTLAFAERLGLNPVPWDSCCSLDPF